MHEQCEASYEEMRPEIDDLHRQAQSALTNEPKFKDLFKGWKVLFSPILCNPKILFIGINPGGGETGGDSEQDKGQLEYLHEDYLLAKETKKVFEMADRFNALYSSSKTNYYYLATDDLDTMFKITDFLGRKPDDLGEKLIVNARKWTRRLIEIMQPEVIVCEGKEAYARVTDLFLGEIKMKEDVEHVYVEEISANIIGYKRVLYSEIKNKEMLAETIKALIN